jgi:3-hydroxyisobutyrate dehydrogenase-like beta-hydroxyacid dehydrogenase
MLSLVCSGPREAFDELSPVLNLLGRHVTYVGDGEHARLVKICHNILLGVVAQSLAEITVLAEKGGVPRVALLDFINNSVMGSAFSRYKTPAFVNLDFAPTFTPVLLRKDFDLGARAADELGVPMPVASAAREPVQAAIAQGRTTEDFAVLLELQARASGLELVSEDVEVDDGLTPVDGAR